MFLAKILFLLGVTGGTRNQESIDLNPSSVHQTASLPLPSKWHLRVLFCKEIYSKPYQHFTLPHQDQPVRNNLLSVWHRNDHSPTDPSPFVWATSTPDPFPKTKPKRPKKSVTESWESSHKHSTVGYELLPTQVCAEDCLCSQHINLFGI